MNSKRQLDSPYFGPRWHKSTRLKAANGLSLRKSKGRFRSKPMMKIDKECRARRANMNYMNLCKSRRNVSDQQVNIVKQGALQIPPKDSNIGPSNALMAKNGNSKYLIASKHTRRPNTLRPENSSNPSSRDFTCSKPSRVRNVLPPKKLETPIHWKSKDDSNAKQSNHLKSKNGLICNKKSSRPSHLRAMADLIPKAKNVRMSNLNGASGSRWKGQSNPYQGEDINVEKDGTRNSKPLKIREVSRKSNIQSGSGLLVPSEYDSTKEKGMQNEVMGREKGMNGQTGEGRVMRGNCHKQMDTTKTKEAQNSSSSMVGKKQVQGLGSNLRDNSSHLFGNNQSRHHRDNPSFMEGNNRAILSSSHDSREFTKTNLKLPTRVRFDRGNGKTNDDESRRRKQPVLEEKIDSHGCGGRDGAMRCGLRKRWKCIESNEDEDNGHDHRAMAVEHDKVVRQENLAFVPRMKRRTSIETNEDEVNDSYRNPFGVEHDCEGVEQLEYLTHKSRKKRRKHIQMDKHEDANCNQHSVRVKDGTAELAPQFTISKRFFKQHYYCCSKPIDKPRWSGIFKVDKEYISLAGHLSTKWCEKVWKLSSLPPVVQVAKVPRLAVWPNIWKTSKPTGDNIGLYLFPHEMRHDEKLDQLVKEVVDKDLVLQAVLDEAEMLIFPSVLLPEQYQMFQTKHYLWAAFKAKEDRDAVIVEQEEEKEQQHVPNQLDGVQSEEPNQEMILMKRAMLLGNLELPAKSIEEVEACRVERPTNICLEHEASEERRDRDSSHKAVCTIASSAATVPTESTSFVTDTASFPANHGPIDPSTEAPPGSSTVYGIVVRQAQNLDPKVQQFIQEMERQGALVTVMQGQASVEGSWPSNFRTAMQ